MLEKWDGEESHVQSAAGVETPAEDWPHMCTKIEDQIGDVMWG